MNHLRYSLWLVYIVLLGLLLMHQLPDITVNGYMMRRVDILSDMRTLKPVYEEESDLSALAEKKAAYVDTCRTDMTCIEDYSDSTKRGMIPFYEALNEVKSAGRMVRMAVFGDSFIEADILTADLREMLQKRFGGCGVGFVTITSPISGFRPTVRHSFSGWSSHAVTDTTYFDRTKQGVSGHYFIPQGSAYAELRGQNKYASLLDTCRSASLFFLSKGTASLSAQVNQGKKTEQTFAGSPRLQKMEVKGKIGSVRWNINSNESSLFYGMAMDGTRGVIVDNFSLRGSSGLSLRHIPEEALRQFNELRPYDLIILQYGLNIATQKGSKYEAYQKGMLETIAYLKTNFPQAGILLLSVGDRNYKTSEGELKTMPGIKNLVDYQENIAAQSSIAFWNMFEAMGGEGSMATLARAKPSMANLDYTHINFRGGKHLANLLYEALIYGKENYDRRRNYEGE